MLQSNLDRALRESNAVVPHEDLKEAWRGEIQEHDQEEWGWASECTQDSTQVGSFQIIYTSSSNY